VFNGNATVKRVDVGQRAIALTQIDAVLQDPEGMAALGYAQSYTQDSSNLYPGLRAPVPGSFSTGFRTWLTPILQHSGMLAAGQGIQSDSSFFSVVTTASADLLPIQCIPHYDSSDPNLLAAVIYLCDTRFSGTSFYRHRRTGYEEITADNQTNYRLALDHDMRTHGAPPRQYMNGDSLLFETIFTNPLKFNSAIVYPGRMLHAGNIRSPCVPPRDQSEWRLTITALLQVATP
jgi:hypothetical protein